MLKTLTRLATKKNLVSIYTNRENPSRFHFGIVLAVNEYEIAIQMISPNGEDDGIVVMDVENVFRVEEDGQYYDKMMRLCLGKVFSSYDIDIIDDKIQNSVISYAFNNNLIISIELINSGINDIVGFINQTDDAICKIEQVDEYGNEDGISYVSVKDITKVTILSEDEKRIQKLTVRV